MAGNNSVQASADQLRVVAKAFDPPIKTIKTSTEQLTTDLYVLGEPWGNDGMGQQFSANYVPDRDDAIKSLHASVKDLRLKQKDFYTMADNYEKTDSANSQ